MGEVKTLLIRFDTALEHRELPLFRGAVISLLPHKPLVYHNHTGEGLRYGYPLIQYKRLEGRAAILAVGEGVDAIGELLEVSSFDVMIGRRRETLRIDRIETGSYAVAESGRPLRYRLSDWLPLNEANHERYERMEGLMARIDMLERVLTGNILSMLKGVGIFVDFPILTEIATLAPLRRVRYKGTTLLATDIDFATNIVLPDLIGLGRHASVGYGTLSRQHSAH